MTPATDDLDYGMRPTTAATSQPRFGLAVWPLACAACAGLAWAGSWFVISRFIPGADPLACELWLGEVVAIGGGCGFLVGAAAASLLERRASAVLAWGAGAGLAVAAGAGLSVVIAAATHDTLPSVVGSALGFSTAGMLVGLGGHLWRVGGTTLRARSAPPRTVLGATGWAVAGAVVAAASLVLGRLAVGASLAGDGSYGGPSAATLRAAAMGGGSGLLIGLIAGACFGTRRRGFSNRLDAALLCGAGAAVAAAIGGALSAYAVVPLAGVLPSEVSSALGFSATGLLLGLGGYAWSRTNSPAEPDAAADDEAVQTLGSGKAAIGTRRTRPGFGWSGVRVLPALAVSVASLAAAAVIGSAVALVAVGLLGLSVVPVLWSQERRLRELERRFRGGGTFPPGVE